MRIVQMVPLTNRHIGAAGAAVRAPRPHLDVGAEAAGAGLVGYRWVGHVGRRFRDLDDT